LSDPSTIRVFIISEATKGEVATGIAKVEEINIRRGWI